MSENVPNNKAADEIDLGNLLLMIKNGFISLGNMALYVYLFFKKNIFILLGLILLGFAISYGLSQIVSQKLKTEVIVRPNFESADYLEDVVSEIKTNLLTKDEDFLSMLGVSADQIKGFDIELEPISEIEVDESDEKMLNELRYLETLNNFRDKGFAMDILRSELAEKSVVDYTLTFEYTRAKDGSELAKKLMDYINTNEYFNGIKEVYIKNAKFRIENNSKMIAQIDDVIANYSESIRPNNALIANKTFYTEKEPLDVPSLIALKRRYSEDIEEKHLELEQQSAVISILNYGKMQQVRKSFVHDRVFQIPLALVLGFLLYCFIKFLNAKSKELT